MRSLVAVIKIFAFFLLSLMAVPVQLIILLFHKGPKAYIGPWLWHKGVCFIFRIKVQIVGNPDQSKQSLYVSNHLSYLDIPAIGTVLRASFVAKKDVRSWPVFGFLSKMQQTAFIDRNRKAAVQEKTSLSGMISDGKSLIIFPEGTSTDGREVLPFKSSLFSLALSDSDKSLSIQPFSIEMVDVDGRSVSDQNTRDIYAWHRDMDTPLPQHLWLFAKSRGATIKLHFHDGYAAKDFQDRKSLAKECYERVSSGINMAFNLKEAA